MRLKVHFRYPMINTAYYLLSYDTADPTDHSCFQSKACQFCCSPHHSCQVNKSASRTLGYHNRGRCTKLTFIKEGCDKRFEPSCSDTSQSVWFEKKSVNHDCDCHCSSARPSAMLLSPQYQLHEQKWKERRKYVRWHGIQVTILQKIVDRSILAAERCLTWWSPTWCI